MSKDSSKIFNFVASLLKKMIIPQIKTIDFENLIKIVLSGKDEREEGLPATVKGEACVCFEKIIDKKAFHENVPLKNIEEFLQNKIEQYGNLTVITEGKTYRFRITKKKKLLFDSFNNTLEKKSGEKNRTLSLDIPPLYELGVTSKDGKLISGMRDKFVQADRFAEFVVKAVEKLEKAEGAEGKAPIPKKIVDAGCGKAYLSLAVYHHLKYNLKKDVELLGIDLKEDVIKDLNKVAEKYGYDTAEFICADLKEANLKGTDVLISLHACDVATDYVLYGAIKNDVPVILSAPCCQQELNAKIKTPLRSVGKYGLIKERVSALFTDMLRCEILSAFGYKTRVTEFVGAHNTPKNMLIIAEKQPLDEKIKKEAIENINSLIEFLGADITLYKMLFEQ